MPEFFQSSPWLAYGWLLGLLILAVFVAKLLQFTLVRVFRSKRLFHGEITRSIIDRVERPLLWLLIALIILLVLPVTGLSAESLTRISLWLRPLSVALFGWFVVAAARGAGAWLEGYYSSQKTRDSLGTRRFTTQIRILMRLVVSVITILTIVGMAMVVPALRELGMSLFASAGVAGIVLGIAAKESFSNIIAGTQLALTQQILLGDEVVVHNQSGKIEEITSSYVVVRTWDLRRLVIPLRYFMENSFENWTYHETEMFGPVYLYTDYTVNIKALREEARRLVEQSKHWDGKRCELLVTDSNEAALKLRLAVSASNSGDLWALQCETRERLIDYLQAKQPWALPKMRGEQKAIENWQKDTERS